MNADNVITNINLPAPVSPSLEKPEDGVHGHVSSPTIAGDAGEELIDGRIRGFKGGQIYNSSDWSKLSPLVGGTESSVRPTDTPLFGRNHVRMIRTWKLLPKQD